MIILFKININFKLTLLYKICIYINVVNGFKYRIEYSNIRFFQIVYFRI